MNMPVKNGLETLRELRALADYKETAVVGFATTNNKDVITSFIQSGVDEYFQKPDTPDVF